ncbi:MAG: PAS domain-containing protein [Blastocatellia bacterium]|nr:PAS domain-containing protein [Blastocatellia bacterium]
MKRLRVLHIEDSEHDAALIDRALLTGGYELFTERAENAEAMSAALNTKVWDVILCNYSMPHFDALSALAVLKSSGLDIPCIIISGTIGEETAVRAMVAGASDYLMKDNLARLVPAIEREMHDAENRRAQEVAENAFRHSEEQLTALMNSVDGILWEADAQTFQFTFVSPGAERLLGYPLRRWTEEPTFWTDHIHPDDREEAVRYCAECTRDNRDHEFEYRMLAADGSVVWLCDIVTVLMGDGRAKTLSGIMVDITERKQVEGELASSEARLRLALHAARLGTYDWDVPNDHIEWSRWHEELWGYAPGEFNGTYKAFSDRVHPDDLPETNVKVEQCIATRDRFSHEFRVVWPDNSVHWVAGIGEFELDGGGKPIRMLGAVMDITERKRAEAELRTSREHLALAQKVAKLGSWETDLSTLAVTWSEETYRIFEVDVDSFIQTHQGFLQLIHPDDRAAVDKAFFDSFAQQSNCSIKHRLLMPDGRIKFIDEQWEILRDAEDAPVTAVGTCHDITTRTLAEASQQESEDRLRLLFEQMRTDFITALRMDSYWI